MFKKLLILLPLLFLVGCEKEVSTSLLPGRDTVTVFEQYKPEGCVVTIDGVNHNMTIKSNTVDTDVIGTYMVEYTYEDYSCKRVVFVVDDVVPEATLNSGLDTIKLGETWVDAGVTASDNYSDVTITVVYPDEYDNTVEGSYTILYYIEDEIGNTTVLPRVIHIIK